MSTYIKKEFLKAVWSWPISPKSNKDFIETSKRMSELFSAAGAMAGTIYTFESGMGIPAMLLFGATATILGHYVGGAASIPIHHLINNSPRNSL